MIKKPYSCLKPDRKKENHSLFSNFEAKLLGQVKIYSHSEKGNQSSSFVYMVVEHGDGNLGPTRISIMNNTSLHKVVEGAPTDFLMWRIFIAFNR